MNKNLHYCQIALLSLLLAGGCLSAKDSEIKDREKGVHWLNTVTSSQNTESIRNSYLIAQTERGEIIRKLKAILQKEVSLKPEDRARFNTAIKIAGLLRIAELVKPLIDVINFSEEFSTSKSISLQNPEIYTAVYALIKIGKPSIKELIARADKEQSEQTLYLYTFVMVNIEGKDYAQRVLDRIMKKSNNTERFSLCLKYLSQRK